MWQFLAVNSEIKTTTPKEEALLDTAAAYLRGEKTLANILEAIKALTVTYLVTCSNDGQADPVEVPNKAQHAVLGTGQVITLQGKRSNPQRKTRNSAEKQIRAFFI